MLDFFIFKPLFTVASIKEMETQAPVTYQVWVDPTAEANTFIILIFPQWMIFSQLIDASKHIVYTVLAQVAVLYKAMHYVLSRLAFGLKSDVSCFLFYEKNLHEKLYSCVCDWTDIMLSFAIEALFIYFHGLQL